MVDDKTTSAGGWTLMAWKTSLNDQLKGWMKFIPGISGSDEVKNIEKFKGASFSSLSPTSLDRNSYPLQI